MTKSSLESFLLGYDLFRSLAIRLTLRAMRQAWNSKQG